MTCKNYPLIAGLQRAIVLLALSLSTLILGCATQPTEQAVTQQAHPATEKTAINQEDLERYHQALTKLKQGDFEAATKTLNDLAKRNPDSVGIWLNLAEARYGQQDLSSAESALTKAQSLSRQLPELENLSDMIACATGHYKDAEAHYLQALALRSHYPQANYNLALLYDIYYQNLPKAIKHYQAYLAETPDKDEQTQRWVEELQRNLKHEGNH